MDSLEDPQNVGTLLRSAEAAGIHGVVFPTHRQAPLTPAAIKASAGATEHLALAPVDDLAAALADLHVRGVRIVGSDAEAPLTARQADLRGPLAIVIGSEGRGLGAAVRRRCDLLVRIPMRGRIGSLNAAVAGSILVFEAVVQREPAGPGVGEDQVVARAAEGPAGTGAEPDPGADPGSAVGVDAGSPSPPAASPPAPARSARPRRQEPVDPVGRGPRPARSAPSALDAPGAAEPTRTRPRRPRPGDGERSTDAPGSSAPGPAADEDPLA
jgi:tRNA(Leu) C34 or U34 (ribose-2'-O)-methylase TrmL